MKKSDYGPKGTAAHAQYQPHANQERKARNVETIEGAGKNKNVKAYSTKIGQRSAKQQAAWENSPSRVKAQSGPVKTLSPAEAAAYVATIRPPGMKKDEDFVDETSDGKQERVEGKESLKKDPKSRWNSLKKALDNKKAFIDLDEALADDEPEEQPEQSAPEQAQPEVASQPQEDESQADDAGETPEQDQGDGEDQAAPQQSGEPDPQELIDALKDEGYSDQEIAYIVHGHHAAEVDPTKQAKAQATSAMSDLDLNNAQKMALLEQSHASRSMDAEHEHKKRMSDLEYENAQKEKSSTDMEQAHKQRMLDLEYEQAKKQSPDDSDDREADKQIKMLEVEKKRLELEQRKEEMKLELEFKKREHELKLKQMEYQMKEQAKQKSEISGIKHEQRLEEAKNPPKEVKKPLKKSEGEYE